MYQRRPRIFETALVATERDPGHRVGTLRLHEADNVAVIVNDGGVSAGTALGDGLRVRDSIPQFHKVALRAPALG